MRGKTYKLEELAAAAEVSPRTVRYYVQRGLLEAPEFRGRDTVYGEEHLVRLRAIRKLQEQYLPLDAIQAELLLCTPAELDKLADGQAPRPRPTPLPMPMPRPVPRAEALQRHLLAPGVELLIAERAGLDDELVEEVKTLIERHMKERGI